MEPTEARGSSPAVPAIVIIAGVLLVVAGVTLNESGLPVGRYCVIGGIGLSLVGAIWAIVTHRRGHEEPAPPQETVASCVEKTAHRHGFELTRTGARGRLKERQVELTMGEGTIAARAHFKRPLDLGLAIHRGEPEGDARRSVRSGDDAFDTLYSVRGDEPDRIERLLSERLRELLVEQEARLDDEGVVVELGPFHPERMNRVLKQTAKIAAEVDRACARVPCASFLEDMREAWSDFAAEHALATADTPLAVWGVLDGLQVSARSVRDGFEQVHFEMTVDFPAPLERGLAMRPASSSTRHDRPGPPVGHPTFDRYFVLEASDEKDGPRLVGGETRNAILELRDEGVQLRIHDRGLWAWAGFRRDRVGRVPAALERMMTIGKRVLDNAQRHPPAAAARPQASQAPV